MVKIVQTVVFHSLYGIILT